MLRHVVGIEKVRTEGEGVTNSTETAEFMVLYGLPPTTLNDKRSFRIRCNFETFNAN